MPQEVGGPGEPEPRRSVRCGEDLDGPRPGIDEPDEAGAGREIVEELAIHLLVGVAPAQDLHGQIGDRLARDGAAGETAGIRTSPGASRIRPPSPAMGASNSSSGFTARPPPAIETVT